MKHLKWGILFSLAISMGAHASDLPQNFNLSGVMTDASGVPLSGSQVVKFQIFNPSNTCLLFEETQTLAVDPDGRFSAKVGAGTKTPSDPGVPFRTVFQNRGMVRTVGAGCSSGYTPAYGDSRNLVMTVGSTVLSPLVLSSVPMATVAETLQGLPPSSFILANTASNLSQTNMEHVFSPTNYPTLVDLLAGNSQMYAQKSNGVLSVAPVAGNPGSMAQGNMWYDTSTNTLKYYTGSTVETLSAGGASLPNVGAAGTYTKVVTDPQGRVISGSVLMGSDMPPEMLRDGGSAVGAAQSIGTTDMYPLHFKTQNVMRMTLDPFGNIGVGTGVPMVSLDMGMRTDSIRVPKGTTPQRPSTPVDGDMRFNTSMGEFEFYQQAQWTPLHRPSNRGIQAFTTVGSTNFTVPSGVSSLKVTVIGGGGGGCASMGNGGHGGTGLAYVNGVVPGSMISLTVGMGGTIGNAGTGSSFGSHVTASGGMGCTGGIDGTPGSFTPMGGATGMVLNSLRMTYESGQGGPMGGNGTQGIIVVEW